jgi:hypothetical protein
MTRTLKHTVIVNGEAYLAGSQPPADIAETITNEHAWESDDPQREEPEPDNEGGLDDDENEEHDGTEGFAAPESRGRRKPAH